MTVAVLIPYRVGCGHRDRALMFVISRLASYGWPVVIGHHDRGPWCKAHAVADALDQTHADVLVIHDADVVTEGLPAAVRTVQKDTAWAIPHRSVHRLSEAATERFTAGEPLGELELVERAYRGTEGGGVVVVHRDVYTATPLDARFCGWGGEDEAWGTALRTLHGEPWRPHGHNPLIHLWHPEPQRATRAFGSLAGRDLRKRYVRASGNRDVMRALVEEGSLAAPSPAETCPAGSDPA